jgi:hypothetical protein
MPLRGARRFMWDMIDVEPETIDPTATRTLVHFVGGPWDAMHSHYRGVAGQAPMDCPGGRYAFHRADGTGALVYVFCATGADGD